MKPLGIVFSDTARLHHRFHHMIFESFGIYRGQPRLFFVLHDEREPINQTSLAKKMNISPSTLTRMVQSLEKKGLVVRHIDENNQRQTLISLTEEGKAVHLQIRDLFSRTDERIFHSMTEEEQEIFRKLLLKVQEQMSLALEEREEKR